MFHRMHIRTGTPIKLTVVLLLCCVLAGRTLSEQVPRPRGVSLAKTSLYVPSTDKSWVCLDGSRTIRFLNINDDYCDCPDGSDEPGTSACALGTFHCLNSGHRSMDIPSSRVNDGICDCCDGSDEFANEATCSNVCSALGQAEQELRKSEAELHKKGNARRLEMIARGKQMRLERESRRVDLEKKRIEQDGLKTEKEEIKNNAETLEKEAIAFFNEQQQEFEEVKKPAEVDGATGNRIEAETSFIEYDKNKDGFVEVTELQIDMRLDRDRNGVVTVEEAKYFLDERDRIDMDSFVTLAWPRIKSVRMFAEGLFEPPQTPEQIEKNQQERGDQPEQEDHHSEETTHEEFDEEEEEHYEEEEEDVGVGEATPADTVAPTPVYDSNTQALIEQANQARLAFSEAEHELRVIEREIKEIDDANAKDYGLKDEYAAMDGECFKFEDREYIYTLCPFDRAAQKPKNGGAETTLGRWDQWLNDSGSPYTKQKYSHGATCWNGPQRSALVNIKCALENAVTAVSEPNRCEYLFEFETPAACDDLANAAAYNEQHDEL